MQEFTRGQTERNEYEKETRRIRYGMYATAIKELGAQGIIFGHHVGDVQENVVCNAMKGYGLLSLSAGHTFFISSLFLDLCPDCFI